MIMGIGVVSLATLFPLSVLRSIKASQLTNATDLRYNVESILDTYPKMVTDPFLIGNPKDLGYVQDIRHDPNINAANNINVPNRTRFIIDPLGWNDMTPFFRVEYGNQGATTTRQPLYALPRSCFGFNTIPLAQSICTLPDHWDFQYELEVDQSTAPPAVATGAIGVNVLNSPAFGATLVNLPAGINAYGSLPRVTLFAADGVTNQVRTITQFTGPTILWTEDVNGNNTLDAGEDLNNNGAIDPHAMAPPPTFVPVKARIDAQSPRYTWLLTVRRTDRASDPNVSAEVDAVILFRRHEASVDEDEWLHEAQFVKGINQVRISYLTSHKPNYKPGGYVLDADNAFWYRIRTIVDDQAGNALLTLETSARENSPQATSQQGGTNYHGRAMFPRSVVDVFPMGTKSFPVTP
jgi:hypothetical protein